MIVALDANVLVYLLDPRAKPPLDLTTGQPVERCAERLNHLVTTVTRAKGVIIVPTPALGEVLVKAGDAAPGWLRILNDSRHFRIVSFDQRAAVEFAARRVADIAAGTERGPTPRAKARFDEQIAAIAIVEGAETIYSDDGHIANLAQGRFTVIGTAAMPLPPEDAQARLPFGGLAEDTEALAWNLSVDDDVGEAAAV